MSKDTISERVLKAKELRKKELTCLPFKKKIEILIQLQKMANGIKKKDTYTHRPYWNI